MKKKVETVLVINLPNINKANNNLSFQLECLTTKKTTIYDVEKPCPGTK
jgi:hypothetical protein